jgi:hypothetical protein
MVSPALRNKAARIDDEDASRIGRIGEPCG